MFNVPFLEGALTKFFKTQSLDDVTDRLNYMFTSSIFLFFTLMVSAKQYVGSPIQCWTPQEFKGGWDEYVEDYCFIQNTYYVPINNDDFPEDRSESELGYYQWVPIVLAIQGFLFFLPNWIWNFAVRSTGVDVVGIVNDAEKLCSADGKGRGENIVRIASYISDSLGKSEGHSRYHKLEIRRDGLSAKCTVLYCLIKVLYCANAVFQLILLNSFLGHEDTFWGWNTFRDLVNEREWHESGVFPRVTFCDLTVRALGNVRKYTVQCVLMINMFNEKIYLFLWFWIAFVALVTTMNCIYTVVNMALAKRREDTVARWLKGHVYDTVDFGHVSKRFTGEGIKPDGILVLKFIESHAGGIVAKEIAHQMFKDFLEQVVYSPENSADYNRSSYLLPPPLGLPEKKNSAVLNSLSQEV